MTKPGTVGFDGIDLARTTPLRLVLAPSADAGAFGCPAWAPMTDDLMDVLRFLRPLW